MAVEEKCRGSDQLYDNGYSRAKKSPVFSHLFLLEESRLRLWNSLLFMFYFLILVVFSKLTFLKVRFLIFTIYILFFRTPKYLLIILSNGTTNAFGVTTLNQNVLISTSMISKEER